VEDFLPSPFSLPCGAIGASRTRDPLLRRQMLYPTELQPHNTVIITILLYESKRGMQRPRFVLEKA
jgi:hypothetical protein